MTGFAKIIVLSSVVTCALIAVLAWAFARGVLSQRGVQSYEGYLAPIYSADGQHVYFVERLTSATTRKTKEADLFFGGSAQFDVFVEKDTFSLKRLDVRSGEVEEIVRLSPSPIEGQRYHTIGTPFHVPAARLKFTKDGKLEFTACLTIHQVPLARSYSSSGVWIESQHTAEISRVWEESSCQVGGYDESSLSGDWEVMEVRGDPNFSPVAIAAYNHLTSDVKVLVKNKDYDRLYSHGVPLQQIVESSRRSQIEHTQALLRTHEELMQKYKAMGMNEFEALLRTGKDLQRLGYYPKSTTIVARLLPREQAAKVDKGALFSIAKDEMESGTFADIEKAIASPGEEIDKDSDYPTHRDYTTSARLNAFIETGKTRFYVRYLGNTYELTIRKPDRPLP